MTVQAMVFGNRGQDSGTGVLFTRNPSTGEPALYGDILFNAQGEDVVAGTHATQPISTLDARLPEVSAELRRYADLLERHPADLGDIEFTIEDGRLWLLQVRTGKRSPRAALRMAIDMADDDTFPLSREEAVRRVASYLADPPRVFARTGTTTPPMATGLPASPGVATGGIVTSSDAAESAAATGQSVILVRAETSPEDVGGMAKAAGVLTARGGLASHAPVVARGWGIPAVVGARSVVPAEASVQIGGRTLAVGEQITIDGSTGEIYLGELHGRWEVVPEAATLLGWAAEMGIGVTVADRRGADHATATASADAAAPASAERLDDDAEMPLPPVTANDLARTLAVRGSVTLEQLAEALVATRDSVQPHVDQLVTDGVVETAGDQVRLSAEGKLDAAAGFAANGSAAAIDDARNEALIEQFQRMKEIVTGWQVRDVAGEQVLNDHSDAAYDALLLDDLSSLHAETSAWLSSLSGSLRQFAVYRSRLERALKSARNGDQRFIASPRVDSYHSVWFELHEHLIRLAGRRRTDEAAAGRA